MPKLIINFYPLNKNQYLPYDHQYLLYSSLLWEIGKRNAKLASLIHTQKSSALFVMSQLIPGGKSYFSDDGINADRFVLMLTSSHDDILNQIETSISQSEQISVGPLVLKYHSSKRVNITVPPTVPQLVTRSPIVLREHNRYVSFGDDDFLDVLKSKIIAKVKIINPSFSSKISFLRIVEGRRKSFSIRSGKVTCSIIKFIIDADQTILESILIYGIGAKTQMGFGMIEVVE